MEETGDGFTGKEEAGSKLGFKAHPPLSLLPLPPLIRSHELIIFARPIISQKIPLCGNTKKAFYKMDAWIS